MADFNPSGIQKSLQAAILIRLNKFLECLNILSPNQFGFRENKSTIDATSNVVDVLVRQGHVLSVFLDLPEAAFCADLDSVTCHVEESPSEIYSWAGYFSSIGISE
ncbi:hypothetical protein J6590_076271 [Homalodisca vitripennis]|nr:hypothetical protein J6590_076271 [Homalodisca vitripennis]